MAGDLGSDELLREWQSGGSALGADAIGALVSLLKNASSEIRRGEVRAASPPGHGRFDCAHRGGPASDAFEAKALGAAARRLARWPRVCVDVRRREALLCRSNHSVAGGGRRDAGRFLKAFPLREDAECDERWFKPTDWKRCEPNRAPQALPEAARKRYSPDYHPSSALGFD